jgi:hypothetical protein
MRSPSPLAAAGGVDAVEDRLAPRLHLLLGEMSSFASASSALSRSISATSTAF